MKKVLKILTLVMLIFTIIKIGDTYAKYYASANTENLYQDIGKWVIHINEMDIYSESGETITFNVNNFSNFTNTNTEEGKISPASTGYSEIVIDPTGTDVAVRYDIEINLVETVENLAIEARLEMASGEQLTKTGENTYSGIINLADVKAWNKATVRCYVTWNNDETKNIEDTELASVADVTFSVPANVTVSQYLGETLTEYVPAGT